MINSVGVRVLPSFQTGEVKGIIPFAQSTLKSLGEKTAFSASKLLKFGVAVSCLTLANLTTLAPIGGIALILQRQGASASDLTDGYVSFDKNTVGPCDKDEFVDNFGVYPPSSSKANLYYDYDPKNASNVVFRVNFVPNEVGADAGTSFNAPYGVQCLHGTLEYRALKNGTEPDKGDKWPGSASLDTPSGCIDNQDFDGWSARYMTRKSSDGLTDELRGYVYNPNKVEDCGDYYDPNPAVKINLGEWYSVKQEVYVGDPNVANGYIYTWVDDQPVLNVSNIVLGKDTIPYIEYLMMSIFPGGSDETWYSNVTSTLIDDIQFSCLGESKNSKTNLRGSIKS